MGVLKCDCSVADQFVETAIAFPGGGWYLQVDVAIPTAAFNSIIANTSAGNRYTQFFTRFETSGSKTAGMLAGDAAGDAAGLTSPATIETDIGSADATGVFPADTWNQLKFHYDGSTVHVSINGTNYDATLAGAPSAGNPDMISIGGQFSNFFPGYFADIVYYFRDFRVGTTDGGTEVFSDDFSGTLAGWDNVEGATIVADPGFTEGGGGGEDFTTFMGPVRVSVAFDSAALEATPTWTYLTDVDNLVAGYDIDRGRQFEFDKTDGGTARVSINDQNGLLDPTNSAGPYYGLIEPLLQIRLELWDPVALEYFTRFRGWIEDYDYLVEPFVYQDSGGNTHGLTRLEISCVDIFEILTAIEMQPGAFGDTPPTSPIDYSGNIFFDNIDGQGRIDQVLGDASIAAAFYVAFTLNINMQESIYSPSENVLQVIQDVADAEFPTVANVYTDRLGRLAVHGRLAKFDPDGVAAGAGTDAWDFHRWKAGDEVAVNASPTDTAHLRSLSYNRGLSKIVNSALCTPTGIDNLDVTTVTGTEIAGQTFQDAPSIATYGVRSWSAENLLIGAPTGDPLTAANAGILTGNNAMDECLAFATYIVDNYKEPRNRVTELSILSVDPDATGAAANWEMLAKCDISDVVELTVRGPGDASGSYIFNGEEFFVEGVHEEARPAGPDYATVTIKLDLSPKAYFPFGGGSEIGLS